MGFSLTFPSTRTTCPDQTYDSTHFPISSNHYSTFQSVWFISFNIISPSSIHICYKWHNSIIHEISLNLFRIHGSMFSSSFSELHLLIFMKRWAFTHDFEIWNWYHLVTFTKSLFIKKSTFLLKHFSLSVTYLFCWECTW
jgi:hypothetical protein